MQLKKRARPQHFYQNPVDTSTDPFRVQTAADTEGRGLKSQVRFFVDHVIAVAVTAVARKQATRVRLRVTGKSKQSFDIVISSVGEGESYKFVAYTNEMSFFVGSTPGLYVVNQTSRELEHAIYLYISEQLCGEPTISAEISRETDTVFDLPVLEGNSDAGPRTLRVRRAGVGS